jgi:hypothetical protein
MTTKITANELTFGIEFETTMPAGAVIAGGYHRGTQVNWLPEGWTAQRDGSIVSSRGREGVEFVSPILKGADGLAQVLEVISLLAEHGAKVNPSTGLHVHVGGFDRSAKNIKKITTLVANFEKAIFASTGTKSRERGRWCGSVQRHGNADTAITNASSLRYHVLNLTNLNRIGTVEFRAFGGSLNPIKVTSYIRICLGLVERACNAKRVTNFTAKPTKSTSPIARNGEGQTALCRLFYQLGWTAGRTNHVSGNVQTETSPTIKACKKELMRLAKKYDAAN